MTITVSMSQEEFLDYIKYKENVINDKQVKNEINDKYNKLLSYLIEDKVWVDGNKYDKIIKELGKVIR